MSFHNVTSNIILCKKKKKILQLGILYTGDVWYAIVNHVWKNIEILIKCMYTTLSIVSIHYFKS